MGCINSKDKRAEVYTITGDASTAVPKEEARESAKSGGMLAQPVTSTVVTRPRLDPKDFQFVNCKDDVKIKPPGSINGQSFTIDKCEGCDIYVVDYCSQVTIDDCKDCRVFIGPTDGAVFIRDSTNCSLVAICRQLRTRDCHDCRISLYCRTKPIVESSTNIGFGCFDMPYLGVKEHMQNAKLGAFHNFWSDVFDFTPKEGNWHLLPHGTTARSLLEPIPEQAAELVAVAAAKSPDGPAPHLFTTFGGRQPRPQGCDYLFVAFEGGRREGALQMAHAASDKGWLLRTNEARLSAAAAGALADEAGWSKSVGKALAAGTAGCVGLELAVPSAEAAAAKAQVEELGGHITGKEAAGKSFRTMGLDG